jgi:PhoPQ-activated pathogenicity-related protein
MRKIDYQKIATSLVIVLASTEAANAKPPAQTLFASPVLRKYVELPDDSYAWKVRRRGQLGAGSYVELILTSQTWRDIVWKHQLFIYRPAIVVATPQALLLIDGGSWQESLETKPAPPNESLPKEAALFAVMADMMQTPVAIVRQVPEQPILGGRKEDEIIALTFDKFLETGEPDWPLLLPMVKTAIRAMDTVQAFAKSEWQIDIEEFLVTGASKRGWTTWLTAATDRRVNAIAPIVINMLNMTAHVELQKASFGGYSEEISDYSERGLQDRLHTQEGAALQAIVDPYAYRKQLLQPKLIILGTNDAYWPVDSLNLYWNELEGEKYILYVPNEGHGIRDYAKVIATVTALQKSLIGGPPLPKLAWHLDEQSSRAQLDLTSNIAPSAVRLWTAEAESRDFRKAVWTAQPLSASGNDTQQFVAGVEKPAVGFKAMFIEAEFPADPAPYNLSTTLHIFASHKSE